jgi:hypothetical protein
VKNVTGSNVTGCQFIATINGTGDQICARVVGTSLKISAIFKKDLKLRKYDLVTLSLYIASPAEFLNFWQNLIKKDGLPCANYI